MNERNARHLADETRRSYDKMASEFSASRAKFWDELAFLADHIHHDDHVLDIGCGNGRLEPLVRARHAAYTGVDYSTGLLSEARKRSPEATFVEGDATALPFHDRTFDIAYAFAVVHHIPSAALRKKFLTEAYRVLEPDGVFIFTAWDLWNAKHFPALLRTALSSLLPNAKTDIGDAMLTFGKNKEPRYVHACTEPELVDLALAAGFVLQSTDVVERNSGERNIIVVARKPLR